MSAQITVRKTPWPAEPESGIEPKSWSEPESAIKSESRAGARGRVGAKVDAGVEARVEARVEAKIEGLWRARELPRRRVANAGIGTGFPALDDVLAERGWPQAGLVELLCEDHGIGELRLLSPALATQSSTDSRCIAWVNPPYLLYPPALQAVGVDPARVLVVHAKDHGDALWAFELAVKSGACCAVLGWLQEPRLRFTEIRRLQFAAKQGRTWANLFRPVGVAREASAAELRLRLRPVSEDRLNVDIVKRRGGWPLSAIELPLGTTLTQRRRRLRAELERWRRERFGHRGASAPSHTETTVLGRCGRPQGSPLRI